MSGSSAHSTAPDEEVRAHTLRRMMMRGTLVVGLGSTFIFLFWPMIDQWVAALFIGDNGGFGFKRSGASKALRFGFKLIFVLGGGIAIISLIVSIIQKRAVFGFGHRRWLYLVLTLIIGPGLVANSLLKDHWGRARPHQVMLDNKVFTPALVPSNQCDRNCSFVSGESASHFALFFGLALMGGARQWFWLHSGLALGSLAGLMRMAQGGHYLSDVVFSGIFMALVALALSYWLIDGKTTPRP